MGALTHNGEVLQSLPANASQINFDKTGTDLNATQVENAIKEVNGKVNTNAEDITQLKSGLTKVASLSDNIHIDTQKGALYRTSPIPITCESEPTNVVVSVTRASGAIIGAMVHSISGTTVNVIIWATEETQEQMKVVLFYR